MSRSSITGATVQSACAGADFCKRVAGLTHPTQLARTQVGRTPKRKAAAAGVRGARSGGSVPCRVQWRAQSGADTRSRPPLWQGDAVVAGTRDGGVCCWDATSGEQRWSAERCLDGAVVSLAHAPACSVLYCAASDGIVETDSATGLQRHKWAAGQHAITCVAASPGAMRAHPPPCAASLFWGPLQRLADDEQHSSYATPPIGLRLGGGHAD